MPECFRPETLEKRYLGKLSKKALAFMKSLLKLDPKERPTATQALANPYFDNLKNKQTEIQQKEDEKYRIKSNYKQNNNQ